ncbi:MAG TPA: ABC transporter substrate-binding protein [Candidatus Lustribacter sp.]|nr:ABC transporter substrate-binding protein [Candidatus Lustribacter sp.]
MRRAQRLVATALAALLAVTFAPPRPVRGADAVTVRVGVLNVGSDAPFLIADKKGYFKDEGLNVVFTTFASAGNMVVPLSAGQLDAGGGAPAVAIYNAAAHGIDVKVVADRASDAPGYGFDPLLVRTELIKSGRYKSPKDLKGMTIAGNQPGSVSTVALYELLKKYGLSMDDVKRVNLDYPDHVAALANGKVDASITTEPQASQAVLGGGVTRIMGDDAWYPNQEISVLIFSGAFMRDHRDLAVKFMRAYVRAVRYYVGALRGGHFAGPNAADVISILSSTTSLKDPAAYQTMTPGAIDPNGKLNLASMRKDLQYFKDQGLIEGNVKVEDIVDESILNDVLKQLGPYKGPRP